MTNDLARAIWRWTEKNGEILTLGRGMDEPFKKEAHIPAPPKRLELPRIKLPEK